MTETSPSPWHPLTFVSNWGLDEFAVTAGNFATESALTARLSPGEMAFLSGPIGSGKSLVLEALSGAVRPSVVTKGRVWLESDGERSGPRAIDVTGFVPQDSRLMALGTDRVANLLDAAMDRNRGLGSGFAARLRRQLRRPAHERAKADELLERLGLLPRRLRPLEFRELSHGERHRLLLALALLEKNPILAYDGLGEGLDSEDRRRVSGVLTEWLSAGGILLGSGRRHHGLELPTAQTLELGHGGRSSALPLVRRVESVPDGGREPHLLEVEQLRVGRGRRRIGGTGRAAFPVDGVSLALRRGESLVLLGSSGSGKTTLLETVAGLLRPAAGRVRLLGRTIVDARRAARHEPRVQLVFQDANQALAPERTVRQHLDGAAQLARRLTRSSTATSLTPAEWLQRLGLDARLLDVAADQLSTGEAQRIDLGRSLLLEPELTLLDAPRVAGVDADAGELLGLVLAQKEQGRSFLIATSDPGMARGLADRIVVLHAGRVVEVGRAEAVLERPAHPATRALLDGRPGTPADPRQPLRGCPFVGSCPRRELPRCDAAPPALIPPPGRASEPDHRVACYHPL